MNDIPGITVKLLQYVSTEKPVWNYLPAIHESETIKVIDAFLAKQKKELTTKELLSNVTLLQNFNDRLRTIDLSNRFVGYVITPRESKSIVTNIQQAGFISPIAQTFTLYLFDSANNAAVQTKTIAITVANQMTWFDLGWEVWFDNPTGGAGERYLLGYFEEDLTSGLYESDWTGAQAHVANRIFRHYMGISPFRFSNSTLNSRNIPQLRYLQSSLNCQAPGFNLRFNSKCDITKILKDNIDMFGQAVQYQIAIRVLNDALSNIELNNVTSALKNVERWKELVTEYTGKLHGGLMENVGYIPGIIDRLSIDFSNMDAVCLKRKSGEITGVKW